MYDIKTNLQNVQEYCNCQVNNLPDNLTKNIRIAAQYSIVNKITDT